MNARSRRSPAAILAPNGGGHLLFVSRPDARPRLGIFASGLDASWPQFPSLYARLNGYLRAIETQIAACGKVVPAGMVDIAEAAQHAAAKLAGSEVDLLFVYAATYATPSVVLPIVQPTASLDWRGVACAQSPRPRRAGHSCQGRLRVLLGSS